MSINNLLPFASTVIMLVFALSVLQRYLVRRNPAFLFWGVGLLMFGSGSFAEAFLVLAWSPVVFFIWYLFGAALNAAWLGHGTLHLLVKKRWAHVVTGVLVVGGLLAHEHRLVNHEDLSKAGMAALSMNGIVSVTYFLFTMGDLLIR